MANPHIIQVDYGFKQALSLAIIAVIVGKIHYRNKSIFHGVGKLRGRAIIAHPFGAIRQRRFEIDQN